MVANIPRRGHGELRVDTRIWPLWCSSADVAGAFACGLRIATRLALDPAVSGRGEASGMGSLAGDVAVAR